MDRTHCPQCIYHPRTVQIEEFYSKTLKSRVASEESSRIWDDVTNTNILRVYDSDNVPSFGYRIDRMPVSGSIRINIYNFITFLYEWFGKKKKIPIQKCEKIEIKRRFEIVFDVSLTPDVGVFNKIVGGFCAPPAPINYTRPPCS